MGSGKAQLRKNYAYSATIALQCNDLEVVNIVNTSAALNDLECQRRKRSTRKLLLCFCSLIHASRGMGYLLPMKSGVMGLILRIKQINNNIQKKYIFTHRPPPGVESHSVESTFWDNDLFNAFFRFKKEEFLCCIDAMHLTGKYILCGGKGHSQYFPADICLMVVMSRLAFPSRFVDLVLIFGIPSGRICDIFHSTIDYLYLRYAQKLNKFDIWVPKFPEFAAVFRRAGSTFPNQIANFDGNFKGLCRPGGLGNSGCRLDQSEMYTGERKASMASSTSSHSFQTDWHPSLVFSRERHMTAKFWTTAAGCKFCRKKQRRGKYGFYLAMLVLPSVNSCNLCIEHFPATSCAISGLSTTICPGSESTLRITLQVWAIFFRFWVSRTVSS